MPSFCVTATIDSDSSNLPMQPGILLTCRVQEINAGSQTQVSVLMI